MYVDLWDRPDILLAVYFLSTRVTKPILLYQCKLKWILEYIKGSLGLTYTIRADSFDVLFTFVDAAYGDHPILCSQTGGCLTLGTGGLLNQAYKQKINTKSST